MLKSSKKEKVCALDLDNTLNEWESFFVKTFNEKNNTSYVSDFEIRSNVNAIQYDEFKHWFRDSGVKVNIPARKGAAEFTRWLKKRGFRIVIISSRPYKEYSRIYPDTIRELKKGKILFDDLYFEENKHLTILKKFPNLKFMVEDNLKYVKQVANEKYKVFWFEPMLNGKYLLPLPGLDDRLPKNVMRVRSFEEIKKLIQKHE
jgi:FMN phosphatase YigB (HAD superfamily)